jgi:O-succinylbenzoate synthase
MQISGISAIAPIVSSANSSSGGGAEKPVAPGGSSSASAQGQAAAVAVLTTGSAGASSSQNVSSSAAVGITAAIATVYNTTYDGKTYVGSVQEQSADQYLAEVRSLPGATASGESLRSAEANLNTVISLLV